MIFFVWGETFPTSSTSNCCSYKEEAMTMKPNIQRLVEQRLIDQYQRYYRLAFSYVRNEADALDAVQEGACKAISSCGKLRETRYLDTWLYRIMVNEAVSVLRRRSRQGGEDETEAALALVSVQDQYEETDLFQALDTLEVLDRTIVTLRYFEDLKLSEIAEVVQQPLSTVKSRLYRAMDKLRTILAEEGT